jgi:AcrR family transcriptional regulator
VTENTDNVRDHGENAGPTPERLSQVDALHQGLRERKKALMRQLISDTATIMFLERGFDEVRVSEIAAACEVSEKTIYNYFPTKESLLLDREETSAADLRKALGPEGEAVSPVRAMVEILKNELEEFMSHINDHEQVEFSLIGDFNDMIESTPSLKAARADMIERLAQVGAEAMAARAGVDPSDPEPQIAADALTSLWRIYYRSIVKYSSGELSSEEIRAAVLSDVERAARLLDTGLWSFATVVQGANGREQFDAAADASIEARKQVLAALKQARTAWHAVKTEMESHSHDDDDAVRRAFIEVREARKQVHHASHQEAFEIRREARQRAQEIRDLARQRREDARKRGDQIKQEFKKDIKDEARQRGQEIKDAVKRGRRPGRP